MKNRFFTILIIPEKTSQVRRLVIPSWIVRSAVVTLGFLVVLAGIMLFDYGYVMSQIREYRQLKIENRRLQQQVQIYKNKMGTIENTLDRVKTFSTRLKVITNTEDRNNLIQSLNQQKLPDAAANIGSPNGPDRTAGSETQTAATSQTPENEQADVDALLRKEQNLIEAQLAELAQGALLVEQVLQDQYELLEDQKAFLAALPTRKPTMGYYTSGFGVRPSPYGGRDKMHEGLDIANKPGTMIRATADGTIVFADVKPGYGQTVIIDHGYGLETWYGHNRKLVTHRGTKVRRGDPIALLGNTGRSTGPHLHYEVRVHGTPVDPLAYILEN